MNKEQIQDEIKEARQKLERLEAKLKEPEKFEFQGGSYRFVTTCNLKPLYDPRVFDGEIISRTKTEKDCERLAKHLKNAAIIWQVSEYVNDGWNRENGDKSESHEVFLEIPTGEFMPYPACRSSASIFKDNDTAKKACEILNNQDLGYEK